MVQDDYIQRLSFSEVSLDDPFSIASDFPMLVLMNGLLEKP